jgi:hypothetical protein
LILHILRNIDQHRPGTTRSRDAEGARNDLQQVDGGIDEEVVFGNRDAQAVGIDFLEGIGTDHRPRHLPGDRHQRNRIQFGIGDRRQQIGGTGTRGSHAYGRQTGGARHPLCDEAAPLLVPGQDMVDQFRLRQGVVDRQDGAAGNAGQRTNALSFEQTHDNLCAGKGFAWLLGQINLLR